MKSAITLGTKFAKAYHAYFGMPIGDPDKSWAPHFCCGSCRSKLEGWLRGSLEMYAIRDSSDLERAD